MKNIRRVLAAVLVVVMLAPSFGVFEASAADRITNIQIAHLTPHFKNSVKNKDITAFAYYETEGNGQDEAYLCLEHAFHSPTPTIRITNYDMYEIKINNVGEREVVYNRTTGESLNPKPSDTVPSIRGQSGRTYQLSSSDVFAFSTLYNKTVYLDSRCLGDWENLTYARQIALRAYLIWRFNTTDVGNKVTYCDFRGEQKYSAGKLIIGSVMAESEKYNGLLQYAYEIYEEMQKTYHENKYSIYDTFKVEKEGFDGETAIENKDSAGNTVSRTYMGTIKSNSKNGWRFNPSDLAAVKAAGVVIEPDIAGKSVEDDGTMPNGNPFQTTTFKFTVPENYISQFSLMAEGMSRESGAGIFFGITDNQHQRMLGLKKEHTPISNVVITLDKKDSIVSDDNVPKPDVPDIKLVGQKNDAEAGFDGDMGDANHTPRGDGTLAAGFDSYIDGAPETVFYASHNGIGAVSQVAAWDTEEAVTNIVDRCSFDAAPTAAEFSYPVKTVRIDEIVPEGYLSEAKSGTGDGTETYTIHAAAKGSRTCTPVYETQVDGSQKQVGCEHSDWSYEFKINSQDGTGDRAFSKSTVARSMQKVTFVNRIKKGELEVVKKKAKSLDPFGETPNTKEPMENARFSLKLTNGGSEDRPYIRAVLITDGDPEYREDYNTYRVVPDEKGVIYDGSSPTQSLVTNKKGNIRVIDIPYGQYTLKEVAAETEGFILETAGVNIVWDTKLDKDEAPDYDSRYIQKDIVDYPIRNDIRIEKVDSETEKVIPMQNTAFKIRYMGNLNTSEEERISDPHYGRYLSYPLGNNSFSYVFTTDKNGYVTLPYYLEWGAYQLEEIQAPEGYFLGKYDGKGEGSHSEDSENFSNTVTIYNQEGKPLGYTVDVTDLPYVVHKFEVREMGENINNNPILTLKVKDNTTKGKIEILKVGERLTGFKVEKGEYGEVYVPVYEMTPINNVTFEIYAKSDIKLPDGVDAPLFVDAEDTPIVLDTKLLNHAKFPDAVQTEEKIMDDGTELYITTERVPDKTDATAKAKMFTAKDIPNHLSFETTEEDLRVKADNVYEITMEHTPDGYGEINVINKMTETFKTPAATPVIKDEGGKYMVKTPKVRTGKEELAGVEMLHNNLFTNDNAVEIKTGDFDFVREPDPLTIPLLPFFDIKVGTSNPSSPEYGRYAYTDENQTQVYYAVWEDEAHTKQTFARKEAEGYILALRDGSTVEIGGIEGDYVVPAEYEYVPSEMTLEIQAVGGIRDEKITDKYVYTIALDTRVVAVIRDGVQEFANCNGEGKAYSNIPKESDFPELADYKLAETLIQENRIVFKHNAETRYLTAIAENNKVKLQPSYDDGRTYINIPTQKDFTELADYVVMREHLVNQNSKGRNLILFRHNAEDKYLLYVRDSQGQNRLIETTKYGESFNRIMQATNIKIHKSAKTEETITYENASFSVELTGFRELGKTGSKGIFSLPKGSTEPQMTLAPKTVKDGDNNNFSLSVYVTDPSVYMKLNDGTKVGVVYSGGFTFATILVPYGNEDPKLIYKGAELSMRHDELGNELTPETPKVNGVPRIEILPQDASSTRITAELHFSNSVTLDVEETLFTISKKNEGDAFSIIMPDGRVLEIHSITDAVTGESRGMVDITCFTPTYRYLLGQLVDTVTTGIDTEGLADKAGSAVTKNLPMGSYVIREKEIGPGGYVMSDKDYEVTLSYDNQYIPLIWGKTSAENEKVSMKVDLKKLFQENVGSEVFIPKEGAVFGIYADKDIVAEAEGTRLPVDTKTAPAGSLIAVMTTDKEGKAVRTVKAPFGEYTAKEIKTLYGYQLSAQEFPFKFDEKTIASASSFEDAAKGISGEIMYRAGGTAEVRIKTLKQIPAVYIKVGDIGFMSDEEVDLANGNVSINTKVNDQDQIATIRVTGGQAVTFEFGGTGFKLTPMNMAYKAEFNGMSVQPGTDASLNGSILYYEAQVDETGYKIELTGGFDRYRPEILLKNGTKVSFNPELNSGADRITLNIPENVTISGIKGNSESVQKEVYDNKIFVNINALNHLEIITLTSGSALSETLEIDKSIKGVAIKADKDSVITKYDEFSETSEEILPGEWHEQNKKGKPLTLSDGSEITEDENAITVLYADRHFGVRSFKNLTGLDIRAARDAKTADITFTENPLAMYKNSEAVLSDKNVKISNQEAISAIMSDGSILCASLDGKGEIVISAKGVVHGDIFAGDEATLLYHGNKDNFIAVNGEPVQQNESMYVKTVNKGVLTYSENRLYGRSDSLANVMEVKINSLAEQETAQKIPTEPVMPKEGAVINDLIPVKVVFSKQDVGGNELEGATIVLKDESGKIVESWVSDGKQRVFALKTGTYVFSETAAPNGYRIATDISFTVNEDCTITAKDTVLKGEKKNVIVMVDNAETVPENGGPSMGQIVIYKTDGDTKEPLSGVVFEVYDVRGTLKETVTTNEAGVATSTALYYGKYRIKEIKGESGYVLLEEAIPVTIDDNVERIRVENFRENDKPTSPEPVDEITDNGVPAGNKTIKEPVTGRTIAERQITHIIFLFAIMFVTAQKVLYRLKKR